MTKNIFELQFDKHYLMTKNKLSLRMKTQILS